MAEEFRADEPTPPVLPETQPRYNKMILVGTPDWVSGMIARLHSAQIAYVWDWSRLVPTQNPGEVISILRRSPRLRD